MHPGRQPTQRGFTYLWVLVAVALIGIGLTAASEVWLTSARRQRLAQADWAATQITAAIGSYYEMSPSGVRVYPRALEDLLQDGRFPTVRRHLRAIYPNPVDPGSRWELIIGGDSGIRGVRVRLLWDLGAAPREYVYASVANR